MGHTFSNILIHVAFSTKNRQPMIDEAIQPRLHEYLCGIAREEFGKALAVGGTTDHVHGLLSIGTGLSIGEILAKWKSLSSGWIRRSFPSADQFAWQEGYGVFSVSQSQIQTVTQYIMNQVEHHRRTSFEEEYLALLARHRIPFDPTAVWR